MRARSQSGAALTAALAIALPAISASAESPVVRARYLMGTLCEATAHGPAAGDSIAAAFDEIGRLEGIASTFRPESEVSRLNARSGRWTRLSSELWELLSLSVRLSRESGGAFDPTWSSPPETRGAGRVELDPGTRSVRLPAGAMLDFGGVAKGWALDRARVVLEARGTRSALLNFGGQVLATAPPPGAARWTVRLRGAQALLRVKNASVSTSGLDEKPGHIQDPRTGRAPHSPHEARHSGASAPLGAPRLGRPPLSVVAPTGAEADAWSTALFVTGLESAPAAFRGCAVSDGTILGECEPYLIGESNEIPHRSTVGGSRRDRTRTQRRPRGVQPGTGF